MRRREGVLNHGRKAGEKVISIALQRNNEKEVAATDVEDISAAEQSRLGD